MMELWRWNGYVVLCCMSGAVNFTFHDGDNTARVEAEMGFGEILLFYHVFTIWTEKIVLDMETLEDTKPESLEKNCWIIQNYSLESAEKGCRHEFQQLHNSRAPPVFSNLQLSSIPHEMPPRIFHLTHAAIKAAFHKSCYLMTAPRHTKEDV